MKDKILANRQFIFNLIAALSITGLGMLVMQRDPAGISLLTVGIILALISTFSHWRSATTTASTAPKALLPLVLTPKHHKAH